MLGVAAASDPPVEEFRVGEYYADYSPITPGEIAKVDPELEALLKRSKE